MVLSLKYHKVFRNSKTFLCLLTNANWSTGCPLSSIYCFLKKKFFYFIRRFRDFRQDIMDIMYWGPRSYRKSVLWFSVSVLGRLRDLQYIFAVTSGSSSIISCCAESWCACSRRSRPTTRRSTRSRRTSPRDGVDNYVLDSFRFL